MFLWLLGAALLGPVAGFYLPGLAPVSFCEKDQHQVPDCKVNMYLNMVNNANMSAAKISSDQP